MIQKKFKPHHFTIIIDTDMSLSDLAPLFDGPAFADARLVAQGRLVGVKFARRRILRSIAAGSGLRDIREIGLMPGQIYYAQPWMPENASHIPIDPAAHAMHSLAYEISLLLAMSLPQPGLAAALSEMRETVARMGDQDFPDLDLQGTYFDVDPGPRLFKMPLRQVAPARIAQFADSAQISRMLARQRKSIVQSDRTFLKDRLLHQCDMALSCVAENSAVTFH